MDHYSKNDLETAKAVELFLQKDVGKPGEEGWLPRDLASAKYVFFTRISGGFSPLMVINTATTGR